jgi:hypothetical protein
MNDATPTERPPGGDYWRGSGALRARAVSSMPLMDGVGITVVRDDQSTWRFGDLHRGLDPVTIHIRDADRQRGFVSAQAAADHFREQYGWRLRGG